MNKYDKDEIKNSLTLQQVYDYVAELGGDPKYDAAKGDCFVSRTICHNPAGTGSYKLYYYSNSHLFQCYTSCGQSFDIFELVKKVASLRGEDISLYAAVKRVAAYFGIAATGEENFLDPQEKLHDWEILRNYKENSELSYQKKIVEYKEFDENILRFLPRPRIEPWLREGIAQEVMDARGICYNPVSEAIVIPHYDENGALIGIRERTLIKENEVYGKYRPAVINGKMYSHALGFALYNLNNSKDNIRALGMALVFEGEKSSLLYASHFGLENDISVATCGSNLIQHQVDLLLECGAREIVIAFDKQWKEPGDLEFQQWTRKLEQLHIKYGRLCQISFIFDKSGELLGYKDSPIDQSKEVFLQLFKERIRL